MAEENPEIAVSARRTESLDAPDISKLATKVTVELFGRVNIVQLIEKANLAVTLVSETNDILGHAAFFDYPNWDYVDQAQWEEWIKKFYNFEKCTPLNTLFLHYFVCKTDFTVGSINEIMRTVFNAVPFIHFITLVIPKDVQLGASLSKVFEFLPIKKEVDAESIDHKAFLCHRYNHCPCLYIRPARVEDHDDLMPIFNKHNTHLTSIYGDFFLSDLIESQDEKNKAVVADVDGTAVGFMSVCTDVNVDVLNQCFELETFGDLMSVPKKRKSLLKQEVTTIEASSRPRSGSPRPPSDASFMSKGDGLSVDPPRTFSELSELDKQGALTPTLSNSTLSSVDKKGKSPVAKGSFRRMKTKSPRVKTPAKSETLESFSPNTMESPDIDIKQPDPEIFDAEGETEPEEKKPEIKKELESELDPVESAFSIQLFCIDEKYEMRSMDFLSTVFGLFPDKEFCVVTIPHTVPEFPLLQGFQRATPKPESVISQELYIFHRNGLISSFTVRPCKTSDYESVQKLVSDLQGKKHLLEDVKQFNEARRDIDGTPIQAYAAECMGQVVGICVIRQEEDIEYIRAHYNIEDFVYFNHHEREEHGHLHHFALNPAFRHYSKHFLKEALRLSRKSCIHYLLNFPHQELKGVKPHTLITCLNELVPVRPRRQILYPKEELGINAPSERILKNQENCTLYHLNRKLTLEPKVVINVRVVVVGASDVGLSCLDTLVFCPHLCFNNLTLISPYGIPSTSDGDENTSGLCLPSSLCFSGKEDMSMSLPTWVSVVRGKMINIDRINKVVTISSGRKVPYDHLLLCTGQQFRVPVPTGADITELMTTSEALTETLPQVYQGVLPKNIFVLNSNVDCQQAADWIKREFSHQYGRAVVYGATIEANICIQSLLNQGVAGERIVMIKPPFNAPSCFNNPYVDELIENTLTSAGVTIHNNYTLARWNDGENDGYLRCVTFTSSTKPLRVECQVFFCFQEKNVDFEAFKAINNSCLVYDGKLVIDSNFRTNDPFIKAAGSLTKYARRYHADSWTHFNFNSREVGARLAESILQIFDPTLENNMRDDLLADKLIPIYQTPKMASAILPGGYHYLHVGKPSFPIPLESLMAQPDYGQELVTNSSLDDSVKYFRLHINQYRAVETITCLSKEPLDVENLICLYGMHERYLNNLVQRYKEGLIEDFYSFFRESWCLALFHDRFGDFREEVREILATNPVTDSESLEDKVRKLIEEDLVLSKEQREWLTDCYVTSKSKKTIEQRLLSFLSYNQYHLPMYARPGMV